LRVSRMTRASSTSGMPTPMKCYMAIGSIAEVGTNRRKHTTGKATA